MDNYGLLSLVPVSVVIIGAIVTKRALEPLIVGGLVGFAILTKFGFLKAYLDALYAVIGENAYNVVIFGLFGVYIKLLMEANAVSGFTKLGLRYANTKKKSGIMTWLMGMIFFVDNFFSILGSGVSNQEIADRNKMSREMFTFTLNFTASAICIIVPYSLWGTFMSGQISETLGVASSNALTELTRAVPFMFYAWISLLFVLLYHLRIIKPYGKMRKAEKRAETTGKLLPEDLDENIISHEEKKEISIWNFLIPMASLIAITIITAELMYGLVVGIALCFILYIPQKVLKPVQACESICEGFSDMVVVTAIVMSAFVLQKSNEQLGLAEFVISSAQGFMSAEWLPAIAFLILLILGFVTGSFWGMAAVCFPIVLPLAEVVGASMPLTIGAVVAGAAAGSTVCFYGDNTTLACGLTKIRNIDYAQTALPLIAPVAAISFIVYIIAGYII